MSLTTSFPSLKPAFGGKHRFVGLYFASSWCPDCAPATINVKALYEFHHQSASGEVLKGIDIVYISSDKSKEEMEAFKNKSHASWHAISFENVLERNSIKEFFGICAGIEMSSLKIARRLDGIPSLVIVDVETQKIVTTNGMSGLNKYGPTDVYRVWLSKKDQLLSQDDRHSSNY